MPPRRRVVEVSIKPIEAAETDLLARWIERGAPEVQIEPDVAGDSPDPLVTDKDRDFWAFQPPRPVEVPTVRDAERVRNPIDAFILRKLEQGGLGLSPEADRSTLLRRVSFDLTGLPPEPDEVEAFVADRSPDAYEAMVDRLLASPRYGERWGRHWLDLAGYADSEGKREQDLPRPFAYRYRDYVIRALNEDKPYDRFLVEQIAGDELLDYEHAPKITPEIYDNLVATGFLRMAPDSTWANITGFLPDRVEVVSDEIDVLGSAVMGITLKCARCHTHKFDPIPHRDYYRLVAVFKGAYDEYDWLKPEISTLPAPLSVDTQGDRHLPHVLPEEREAWKEQQCAGATRDRRVEIRAERTGRCAREGPGRDAAREAPRGLARRPAGHAGHRGRQAEPGPGVSRREVREGVADRPGRVEDARRRLQGAGRRDRREGEGAGGETAPGAEDPGALGSGRAFAHLHLLAGAIR